MPQPNSRSEIDQVIRRMALPCSWHKHIDTELAQCAKQSADILNETDRTDLRDLAFVTIDGADAKDYDDAIYCEESDEGTVLWVAIADVASYVKADSALDDEAFKRGNSTYLPDRVLPMLPILLSNDLCSLLPHEDRPVIACQMIFDKQGHMLDYCFSKAMIRSKCRLTYQKVQSFFEKVSPLIGDSEEIALMLRTARDLYKVLWKLRGARGALDLDVPQRHLCFDSNQCIKAVEQRERYDAHRMIEEFMICANVAAARYLASQKMAFLSRVHEGIKREALPALNNFLLGLGFRLKGTKAIAWAHLIEQTSKHDNKQIIHTMILSALQRAVYAPSTQGHFGLALNQYTHFTSPIRRYPDLLVHRAIHATLGSAAGHRYGLDELKSRGKHCSMTERRSDEAVWDVERYFLCVLAQAKVGQKYTGVITGIAEFGLFIEIAELQTSGLLHVKFLGNDYYEFIDTHQILKGMRSGETYKMGDTIDVMIKSVRPDERKIDLLPVNA